MSGPLVSIIRSHWMVMSHNILYKFHFPPPHPVVAWENSRHLATLATTGLPAKWRLRNKRRNSILMTRHYPDLGSASDWLNQFSHVARPWIRSTTQIWVVTRNQYGISTVVCQTSFGGETGGSVAKCQLFSQANLVGVHSHFSLYCYYYYYYYYYCYYYYLVWWREL